MHAQSKQTKESSKNSRRPTFQTPLAEEVRKTITTLYDNNLPWAAENPRRNRQFANILSTLDKRTKNNKRTEREIIEITKNNLNQLLSEIYDSEQQWKNIKLTNEEERIKINCIAVLKSSATTIAKLLESINQHEKNLN